EDIVLGERHTTANLLRPGAALEEDGQFRRVQATHGVRRRPTGAKNSTPREARRRRGKGRESQGEMALATPGPYPLSPYGRSLVDVGVLRCRRDDRTAAPGNRGARPGTGRLAANPDRER